jgi:transposase
LIPRIRKPRRERAEKAHTPAFNARRWATEFIRERGVRVNDTVSGQKFARTNTAAALSGYRAIAPYCYNGTAASAVSGNRFSHSLLPVLRDGAVVITDNARFHQKNTLKELAGEFQVQLLFLPPYPPDYNPIEKRRSNMKRRLRDNAKRYASLQSAIRAYLRFYSFLK